MTATSELELQAYRHAVQEYLRSEAGASTPRYVARRLAGLDPRHLGISPLSRAVMAQVHNTRRLLEDLEADRVLGSRPGLA